MISRKLIQVLSSVAIIGGAVTYLMSTSMSEEMEYFHPADAVIVKRAELTGQRIRMGGHVAKGSILQKPGTLEYQFQVKPVDGMLKYPEAKDKTITVRFNGLVPDTFKDDGEVIVSGSLEPSGIFVAKDLIAKCPSKYEAEEKAKGTY